MKKGNLVFTFIFLILFIIPDMSDAARRKRPIPKPTQEKKEAYPLTSDQEKKISKATLMTVFEAERKQVPALDTFLQDESKKPFQQALADLQAKHHVEKFPQKAPIGRRQALTSWIQQEKNNYIKNTGIAEFISPPSAAPVIDLKASPVITRVMPGSYAPPGLEIDIIGENFARVTRVHYYNHVMDDCKLATDTYIAHCTIPAGANPPDGLSDSELFTFELSEMSQLPVTGGGSGGGSGSESPAPPIITQLHPDEARPDMEIFIFGENFNGFIRADYGDHVMDCKYRTPKEIECYIPKHATEDSIIKVVTNHGAAEYDKKFVLHYNPQITTIEPDPSSHPGVSGFYTGDTVTLKGQNLFKVQEVTFNTHKAASFKEVSKTELKITIPNIAAGTYTLKIKTEKGEDSRGFDVLTRPGPPTITSAPSAVSITEKFNIQGQNFVHVRSAGFSHAGKWLTGEREEISQTQMRLKAPEAPGTYLLTVETWWGEVKTSIKIQKLPVITSISPQGRQLGNPAVIEGKYFEDIESITVGGEAIPSNEYQVNKAKTQITLNTVSWGIGRLSLAFSNVRVKTKWGEAAKPIIFPKEPVIYNAEGHEEKCFPAVGNGCKGGGQEEKKEKTQIMWLAGGCLEENSAGERQCYVTPGSMKHDNCCLRHPTGKRCGGIFKEGPNKGKKASAPDCCPWDDGPYDNFCVDEWADAGHDTYWANAFLMTFKSSASADLTPVPSPKNRYPPGEMVSSQNVCAPNGNHLSAKHGTFYNSKFCCSGYGQEYWAVGWENWVTCQNPPSDGSQDTAQEGSRARSATYKVSSVGKAGNKAIEAKPPTLPPEMVKIFGSPAERLAAKEGAKVIPILTQAPSRAVAEEMIEVIGKKFTYKRPGDNFNYSSYKDVFFVKDGKDILAKDVSVNLKAAPDGSDVMRLRAPKEDGLFSLKITLKEGDPVIWNNPLIAVAEPVRVISSKAYQLTIEKPYSGKITSKDEKINCGIASCYAEYKEGDSVTLVAKPDSEYTKMTGWTGACSGTNLECTFAMDGNKKVGAGFFYERPKAPASQPEKQPEEKTSDDKKYCDPELPKYWQPGCVERGKEAPAPASSEPAQQPASGAKVCDPNVPRYSQPGCVE